MKSFLKNLFKLNGANQVYQRSLGIGLIICLSMVSENCHQESAAPVVIDIKFGFSGLIDGAWTFVKFKDQNQISSSDFLTFTEMDPAEQGILLRLIESGVPCNGLGYSSNGSGADLSSVEYLFNLSTSKDFPRDKEIFITGKNGFVSGAGGGWNPNNNCSIEVVYLIPTKLTSHFTVNNDTLEINPLDTVKVNYRSLYTSKSHSAKIAITQ